MKSYIYCIIIGWFLFSCKEEPIGQYPIDGIPPQPVSNPVVKNLAGKAIITYQLPDETDLLYVKAVYTLPDGSENEVKASSFTNTLEVGGFGKSAVTSVKLISVDRSRNESTPVTVDVHPEDSPIYGIRNSLITQESWGGFRVFWENPLRENVVVEVMKKNDDGVYRHIESFYSSEKSAKTSVRRQDPVLSDFAIYVRDTYKNFTDTLYVNLTPWFEQQLDKNKFVGLPKSSKFTLHSFGNSNMSVMWDGVFTVENGVYYISTGSGYYPYFAFDLGVKAKLSRFRYWTRYAYIYKLHSPRKMQLYGTNDYSIASNPESDDSQWTLLNQDVFESYRPSGLKPTDDPTTEDRAYADAGEEFEFPLEAPEVRYIRFKSLESWGGDKIGCGLFISELTFWGSPSN